VKIKYLSVGYSYHLTPIFIFQLVIVITWPLFWIDYCITVISSTFKEIHTV